MDKIKIIVVDDHPMVTEGLRSMLAGIGFAELSATAANAYEALEAVEKFHPDIVITDINMPEISGIELTARIKKDFPKTKIIAMSTFNERSYITQMISNGADGYLVKNAGKEEIQEAILSVYEGRMYLSAETPVTEKEIKGMPMLSSREKDVLVLIAEGLTNNQIAGKLFVSVHTVDSHRKSLLMKFGVNNTASLIKQASKFDYI